MEDTDESDRFILEHNAKVLDLNLPRAWMFEDGDIPIDVNFTDQETADDWYEGMFFGEESTDDSEGFGTEEEFIGFLPARVFETWIEHGEGENDEFYFKIPVATSWLKLVLRLNQGSTDSPFETVNEALHFMTT